METENKWYTGAVTDPLVPGEPVTLKGQTFLIAPFNIARSRLAATALRITESESSDLREKYLAGNLMIAGIALRANYPQLTDDMIAHSLRVDDLVAILGALRKANGIDEGETAAPATATTGAETPTPTGTD